MLPLLWLALSAPPAIIANAPVSILPAEVAQRLVDPPRCLRASCVGNEWQVEVMPQIPSGQRRIGADDLPGAGGSLKFSNERRDWVKAQGSNARVGMQYGIQALKTRDTSVRVAVDTGYRMQGYADDGTAGTGPILRGQVEWSHALGARTRLSQTTKVETGQSGVYLRNSLLFKTELMPDLTLSSGVEMRRDSDVRSRNKTDATLNLKYAF